VTATNLGVRLGTLFGVGVGPGAPDLLTIRAVTILRRVPVIAAPRPDPESESLALRIAREATGEVPGQETLLLTFPMTRDPQAREAARLAAAREVGARLAAGRDVAFVTEGDPLLYSTFLDLLPAGERERPRVEIVPGVSSITAVGAAAGVALADGDDRVAVLPAGQALPILGRLANEFETLVLLKAGRHLSALREALGYACPSGGAWAIVEASRPSERVMPLSGLDGPAPGYFTTVLVRTRGGGSA
jgi:precorrin-2/cobalt-factor-2 C20-methyltransferase